MSEVVTKARDWFEGRQRGERLPQHELTEDDRCPLCDARLQLIPDETQLWCEPCRCTLETF